MLKKRIALVLMTTVTVVTFVLAGCNSPVYNQTEANVADVVLKTKAARKKSNNTGKIAPPLLVNQGLYVDTNPVSLERQPEWLKGHVVIRGDQLPFSYYSRAIVNGGSRGILTRYQTGLDPSMNVSMNYSGTIKGALDALSARSGYVYSIRRNSVYWQSIVTRTFDIAFMPGSSDYLMGKASGGGGTTANASPGTGGSSGAGGTNTVVSNYTTSDSSDSEYSSLKGALSIWKDLEATIKQMLSPEGKVMVSESTTTITVRDKPTNVQLIAQYIANLNKSMSKQVLVKVQVLEVTLENDFTFGIDWALIAHGFANSNFVLNGNYGTPVSITPFTAQSGAIPGVTVVPEFGSMLANAKVPSYTILFNALNQQGKTSVVSEPRVVCLNNQVSVIRIVTQQGYLASVQNTTLSSGTATSGTNTVTSQLTPGTVITGLTLYLLPKIMKDSIYLQVNADLSTAAPFLTVSSGTGANATSIQVPNITEKHFNQRSMIHSGDTLILSGFRQVKNVANANQFINSQALGGKGSQELNTETIVLITPIILQGTA